MKDERERAERFAELFRAVYLTFHRRDGPRGRLHGASRQADVLISGLRDLVHAAEQSSDS